MELIEIRATEDVFLGFSTFGMFSLMDSIATAMEIKIKEKNNTLNCFYLLFNTTESHLYVILHFVQCVMYGLREKRISFVVNMDYLYLMQNQFGKVCSNTINILLILPNKISCLSLGWLH